MGGGGSSDLLAEQIYAMPECVSVEIGMKNKKKTFTILTSIETAIIPKILIFKVCILN